MKFLVFVQLIQISESIVAVRTLELMRKKKKFLRKCSNLGHSVTQIQKRSNLKTFPFSYFFL